jgi:tetratricopeptide (TPR) repeat protein
MRFDEAEALLHEALDIYRQRGITGAPVIHALAVLQSLLIASSESTGRDDEAERVTQEALAVARSSRLEFPELATMLHRFAYMRRSQARLVEAEQLARQAVDMHRRVHSGPHPEMADALRTLAIALEEQQKFEDAASAFHESLAIFRSCYAENHPDVRYTAGHLKKLLESGGDKSEIDEFESEQADALGPSNHLRLARLLLTKNQSGNAHEKEARRLVQRAIDEYSQVSVDSPSNLNTRLEAVKGYQQVAAFCAANPDFDGELDQVHRRLTSELEALLAAFPHSAECQVDVSKLYSGCAYFAATNQRQDEAADFLRKAAMAVERVPDPARSINALYFLAMARMRLGDEAGYRQLCVEMLQAPGSRGNDSIGMRRAWIWCLGPHPNEDLSGALKNAEEFVAQNSLSAPYYDHNLLGGVLYRAGQYERAAHHLKESIATYPNNPPPGYGTVLQPKLFLAMTYWQRNQRDEARRLLAETEPAIEEWLKSPSHFWVRRALHEVLRKEAENLIQKHQPVATPKNENPTSVTTDD